MPRKSKRFFVHPESISENYASLNPTEAHHLRHVLRLAIGQKIELFDGKGNLFRASVHEFGPKKTAVARIEDTITSERPKRLEFCVAVAMPQRGKMDFLVEKATELGISGLIPIITKRTVVRPSKKDEKLIQRWRAISIQTAKQSLLLNLPTIFPVKSISEFVNSELLQDSLILVPHPKAKMKTDCSFLENVKHSAKRKKRIILFIGPEGGFTDSEINQLESSGAILFSMGETVLKTDTAFIAATSFIKYGLAF